MTQREQIEALKREVAELRLRVEQLRAQGAVHHHHHYPPAPLPPINVPPFPQPMPWQPFPPPFSSPNICQSQTAPKGVTLINTAGGVYR